MKRIVLLLAILQTVLLAQAGKAPKDTTLFTYGNYKVDIKEFYKGFTKNKHKDSVTRPEEVDEYLELYKKFKLKVQDAYDQGLDTTQSFKNELASYRKQIAKPYMMDTLVNDALIDEAYQRMKYEVKASHILIKAMDDASPEDTLKALQKINQVLQEVQSGAITFENAALKYSEDPSAADNQGSLGYFTAFQMIYEFENQAYNTPVGQVSRVFRTKFGYHILKVYDKRPSKGEMTVRHIMIQTNPNPNAEELVEAEAKINEVYRKLKAGEKFVTMVQQYSEDAQSVLKNGELPPFSMTNSRLPENFKAAAFALENDGDFSAPIRTPGGFHILQRVSLKPIGEKKDMKAMLLTKIGRDDRQYRNTDAVYNKATKMYQFKENPKHWELILKTFDSSLLRGEFQYDTTWHKNKKHLYSTKLFSLKYTYMHKGKKKTRDSIITLGNFAQWVTLVQKPVSTKALTTIVGKYYEAFRKQSVMDFYENDLENTNPNFAALYKEYKEGILLFTLTDKKVWSKSVEDTAGLKEYYNQHSDKYVFKDRYEATIFRCANLGIAQSVQRDLEMGLTLDSIMRKHNKQNPLNVSNPVTGKFEMGNNIYANLLFDPANTGKKYVVVEDPKTAGGYVVIQVHSFIPAGKKTLNEARGTVMSDYQNYLEKQWIESLMQKYPVKVNQEAFEVIKARMTARSKH